MARVVCFGELLLRLTAPRRELLFQSERLNVCIGGAEANVAVGLATLGHASAMVSRVPANPLGEAAVRHLRRYGVDVVGTSTSAGRMGLYFVSRASGVRPAAITYDREQSSFALAGQKCVNVGLTEQARIPRQPVLETGKREAVLRGGLGTRTA